jgi:hypothetical protein
MLTADHLEIPEKNWRHGIQQYFIFLGNQIQEKKGYPALGPENVISNQMTTFPSHHSPASTLHSGTRDDPSSPIHRHAFYRDVAGAGEPR